MRLGTLIAIVYIVFLLTQPCADVFAKHTERETRPVMQTTAVGDCEDGGEICSPFCVCSCCSVPASYQHFTISKSEPTIAIASTGSNFDYTNPFTSSFRASVWQPPKQ